MMARKPDFPASPDGLESELQWSRANDGAETFADAFNRVLDILASMEPRQ